MGQILGIQNKQLPVDLIVFEMPNFDMILRIDFIRRNEVTSVKRSGLTLKIEISLRLMKGVLKAC